MKRRERKRLTETRQVASLFRERERGVGGVGLSVGWRQSIVRFRLKCRQYLIDGRGSNRRYTDCSSKGGLILITGVCFMALRERRARNRIKSVFPRACVCVYARIHVFCPLQPVADRRYPECYLITGTIMRTVKQEARCLCPFNERLTF